MIRREVVRHKVVLRLFRVLFSVSLALLPMWAGATELTSPSFKVLDPVFHTGGGGEMSSASFRLQGSIAEIAIGRSATTSFQLCAGFLCFPGPAVAAPAPAPVAAVGLGGGPFFELVERIIQLAFAPCLPPTDLNCDGKVGIQDLSIFLFLTPGTIPNPVDFNDDRRVDVRDLSILFTDWNEKLLTFAPEGEAARLAAGGERGLALIGPAVAEEVERAAAPEGGARPVGVFLRAVAQFFTDLYEVATTSLKSIWERILDPLKR